MSDVVVIDDADVTIAAEADDDVAVAIDFDVEVINMPEQGLPGPQGPVGPPGPTGPAGIGAATPPLALTSGTLSIDLSAYALLFSPTLTGAPSAPTASPGTNTTQIATTAFVAAVQALLAPLASPALTGNPTAPTASPGDNDTSIATTAFVSAAIAAIPSGAVARAHLAGCTLSTAGSSTTFTVAAGQVVDSTNVGYMALASALNKTTGAWAVGSGNGALDTGSIAASTWYHVWLIQRTDTSVVDVLISLSSSTPTMPSPYTLKRRIGSLKTNASSQWVNFVQVGDEFLWNPPSAGSVQSVTTSFATYTVDVPTGVTISARFNLYLTPGASALSVAVCSPLAPGNSAAWSLSANASGVASSSFTILTNTNGVSIKGSAGLSGALNFDTTGWIDRRGRDV